MCALVVLFGASEVGVYDLIRGPGIFINRLAPQSFCFKS